MKTIDFDQRISHGVRQRAISARHLRPPIFDRRPVPLPSIPIGSALSKSIKRAAMHPSGIPKSIYTSNTTTLKSQLQSTTTNRQASTCLLPLRLAISTPPDDPDKATTASHGQQLPDHSKVSPNSEPNFRRQPTHSVFQ
ncbi:hypothetical protein ACLOJK_036937 [Asimina triloba]